jgi:hypothetical protein
MGGEVNLAQYSVVSETKYAVMSSFRSFARLLLKSSTQEGIR